MEVSMNNKQSKKPTNAQLEKRLKCAILHIDKTKETKSIYFDDKGLRLTINEDWAIIATGAHQHVFRNITVAGVSRPYLYTQRFIEIALANDSTWKDEKGQVRRSYSKLFEIIKNKEDKTEYNMCWYVDLWLNNIFSPLYSIDETEIASFLVYEQYLHNVARSQVILSEHTDDMTNMQFVDALIDNEKKYFEGMKEAVIIHKKTDKEKTQEEVAALQEAMVQEKQGEGVGDGK
jgi:hypothetical protein